MATGNTENNYSSAATDSTEIIHSKATKLHSNTVEQSTAKDHPESGNALASSVKAVTLGTKWILFEQFHSQQAYNNKKLHW